MTPGYRVLLWAYPPGSRRAELADTLLMAGRAWPAPREVPNLTWHGLRARLGRPRSRAVVVLALVAAVLGGFLSASLVNRLGWEAVPPPAPVPAGVLTPYVPAPWTANTGRLYHDRGGETDFRTIGYAADVPEGGAEYLAGLRQRLDITGWRVTGEFPYGTGLIVEGHGGGYHSRVLIARNDTQVLRVENYANGSATQSWTEIALYRAEPRWLTGVTVAGGLLGALLAWLLTGWVSRRLEHRRAATLLAAFGAILGFVLLVPAWLIGVMTYLDQWSGIPDAPFWSGLVPTDQFGGTAGPAAKVLAAVLLIPLFGRPRTAPAPDRDGDGAVI